MDKNTFETYEYLPTNNAEAESDQFFVIQDDGTLLLNHQVQYVTEVQDVKEADGSQACAVFDVNPQQFFVDVGNNPTELISVSDNYTLPAPVSEDTNNIYGNSFLLQAVGSEAIEQPEKDPTMTIQFNEANSQEDANPEKDVTMAIQFNETHSQEDADVVNIVHKQGNSATEITLTDQQYKILEQKGWVLLESDGKIFILDAFGLHEVTTDNDLIQSLKNETRIDLPAEVDSTSSFKESSLSPMKLENLVILNEELEQETVEFRPEYEQGVNENTEQNDKLKIYLKNEKPEQKVEAFNQEFNCKLPDTQCDTPAEPLQLKSQPRKIKILTKYSFKDIPDKIVLGKTKTGKRLVAKVVKRTANNDKFEIGDESKPQDSTVQPAATTATPLEDNSEKKSLSYIEDAQFESLMMKAINGELHSNTEEVLDASSIVTQLFHVPEFNAASVSGRHLVITRISEKTCRDDTNRMTSFVTGTVSAVENGFVFIHVPHLLQKLAMEQEELYSRQSSRSVLKPIEKDKVQSPKILQVHISETKHNGVDAVSFLLIDRELPCKLSIKAGPKKGLKLYACSTCASIFHSQAQLEEHQESHSTDSEGALTIDTDKLPNISSSTANTATLYYTVKTEKGLQYCCMKCVKRFNKVANCLRHVRNVHTSPHFNLPIAKKPNVKESDKECDCESTEKNDENNQETQEKEAPFKCKMCTSAYFYPASLSKHINKTHIKDIVSNMIKA